MRCALAAVAAVLAAGTVACTGGGSGDPDERERDANVGRKAASQSCEGLLKPADREAGLPSNLPMLDGATMYEIQTQGATKRYLGYVERTDLVGVRDELRRKFEEAAFEINSADEEEGAEAEFSWEGRGQEGSVQVTPLCQGHIRIRWRVGPL